MLTPMNGDPSISILVVDDDAAVRELLTDYLSDNQYTVMSASNGAAARELLAEQVPHVALLDIGLPGEDGLTLDAIHRPP